MSSTHFTLAVRFSIFWWKCTAFSIWCFLSVHPNAILPSWLEKYWVIVTPTTCLSGTGNGNGIGHKHTCTVSASSFTVVVGLVALGCPFHSGRRKVVLIPCGRKGMMWWGLRQIQVYVLLLFEHQHHEPIWGNVLVVWCSLLRQLATVNTRLLFTDLILNYRFNWYACWNEFPFNPWLVKFLVYENTLTGVLYWWLGIT